MGRCGLLADQEQMFRLIPSPKAEPFKQWKEWSGFTTREYKNFKGLHKENLRDHMTNLETAVNTLAEAFTTELSKKRNPKGLDQNKKVAKDGGRVAKKTRQRMEKELAGVYYPRTMQKHSSLRTNRKK